MPSPCNQYCTGMDIPLALLLWCNEGDVAARLKSPGPCILHLFVVFYSKAETQLRNKMKFICLKVDCICLLPYTTQARSKNSPAPRTVDCAGISITTGPQWGRYCYGQLFPEIRHFSIIFSIALCPKTKKQLSRTAQRQNHNWDKM